VSKKFTKESVLYLDFASNIFEGAKVDFTDPLNTQKKNEYLEFQNEVSDSEKLLAIVEFYLDHTLHSEMVLNNYSGDLDAQANNDFAKIVSGNDNNELKVVYTYKRDFLEKYLEKFEFLMYFPNPFLRSQIRQEIELNLRNWFFIK
jgi:hypothetical protein